MGLTIIGIALHTSPRSFSRIDVVGCAGPILGVQVSDLWTVRDFWEWLAPGYTTKRTRDHALANAAFTSYVGLRNFRDFELEVEAGSVEPNIRVGLWAKVSGH